MTASHLLALVPDIMMSTSDLAGFGQTVTDGNRVFHYVAPQQLVNADRPIVLSLVHQGGTPANDNKKPPNAHQAMLTFMKKLAASGSPYWARMAKDWLATSAHSSALDLGWQLYRLVKKQAPELVAKIGDSALQVCLQANQGNSWTRRNFGHAHLKTWQSQKAAGPISAQPTISQSSRSLKRRLDHALLALYFAAA